MAAPGGRRIGGKIRQAALIWCFLAPALAILLIYRVIPLAWNVVLSFEEWSPLRPARWAGLAQYQEMLFDDDVFWQALGADATSTAPSSSCPIH
jgi:ABC-type sugar transport system permease subunit